MELDGRRSRTRRQLCAHGGEPLVYVHQALLVALADAEAHGDEGEAGTRGAVDVLDRGDTPHRLLQRVEEAPLHLGGFGSGPAHGDVDHRHPDLRLFLPRRGDERERAEAEGCYDQQRRELAGQEYAGATSCYAETHHPSLTTAPSVRPAGSLTTRSPRSRPARTSMALPRVSPTAIQRKRARPALITYTPVRPPRRRTALAGTVRRGASDAAASPLGKLSRAKRPERSPSASGRSARNWTR